MKKLLCLLAFTTPLYAETLQPHKALYSLTLMSEKPHEGIESAVGEFALEFLGNKCNGYIYNQKLVVDIDGSGGLLRSEMSSTNFESGDSKQFQYTVVQKINGQMTENHAGKAVRGETETVVKIEQPLQKEVKLAPQILFPNEHMLGIINAAKKNEKLFDLPLFDGSLEGGKYFNSLTVIGKPKQNDTDLLLKDVKSANKWGVSIGYIEDTQGKSDEKVNFSVALTLYDNGIASTVELINPAFSLKGTLKKIDILPHEKCD